MEIKPQRLGAGFALVATLALTMTALPSTTLAQDDAAATPEGVVWDLTVVSDTSVPADVTATLFMEDGEANGNTGCNSFSGTYTLDGESLTFGENFAVTQAFCEGAAGEVEQAYLVALPTVVGWDSDGQELGLLDGGQGVVLIYEASSPTVDITEADIETLTIELARLHQRIDNTRQDVRQLNVPDLRDRVIANEAVLAEITARFVNLRARVRELEGLEARVAAIEEATFAAVPADE